ncbi:hypothetical protein FDECE_8442 [Fusarium decemcellulare]|nr:hypothetical protein FDECE_8442 [Fusarium decemcellulare]
MSSVLSENLKGRLRDIIDEYTAGGADRKIGGLVFSAFRTDGEPIFEHSSGNRGIFSDDPMTLDTIFWVASFTKLGTSVACMQLVEQGLLRLDDADQVESICPELRDVKVLTQTSEGKLQLVEKVRKITLRMLLTHTAGFGYAFEDDKLAEFGRPVGADDFSGESVQRINRPLVNQPGERFQYGISMDWVGVIIERVTGRTLDEYFKKEIFQPLGMNSVTFHPSEEAKSNLAYMHRRVADETLSHTDHLYRRPLLAHEEGEKIPCAAGHGCYGKPTEFARLISLLLNDGIDNKTGARLLKPETVQAMFTDQIADKPRYSNVCVPVAKPEVANATPLTPMPDDHTEGWGMSFSINHFPEDTGRAAGSGSWEGLANLFWFADRKNNIGTIIASQILPYGAIRRLPLNLCSLPSDTVQFSAKLDRVGKPTDILHLGVNSFRKIISQLEPMATTNEERDAQFKALIDILHSVPHNVFDPFDITRAQYQSAGVEIGVDILIPKRASTKVRPVIITGSSLFPAWFSKWILDFAEEHDAIIISPNYRLLPEVKGRDIMEDMANFWSWVQSGGPVRHLASVGRSNVDMNLSHTLLVGESAGGYLALQSVFSGFTRPQAIIALYPMVDMQSAHYTKPFQKSIVGVSNYPNEAVDDFLQATSGSSAITEADPPTRLDSAIAVVQNGRFLELLGQEPELFVFERIKSGLLPPREVGRTLLPPLFLLHGEHDTAVPAEGTRKLVDLLHKVDPQTRLHVAIQPGDHGFDFTARTGDVWLREGLDFVTGPWLNGKSRI